METELNQRLDRLIKKATELKALNTSYAQQLETLRQKLQQAELELQHHKELVATLQNNIKIIKLAQNIGAPQTGNAHDIQELKRKVNEYIRQIDNCIELLNS